MSYDVSDCFDLIVDKMLGIQKELGEATADLRELRITDHTQKRQMAQDAQEIERLRARVKELEHVLALPVVGAAPSPDDTPF